MIKKMSIILMLLCSCLCLHAQWHTVKGQVVEYDGTTKRKPIPYVEISVMGAGSAVSDQNGLFELKFRVLKAGNKAKVNRIVKKGYVIFNNDEIEEWVIPADPDEKFTVVMCSVDRINKIRQTIYDAAQSRISQTIDNQRKAYDKNLKKKLISRDEYEQKIADLKNEMENRLTDAEKFLEKFVYIDITTINRTEKQILKLIEKGKFEEAMMIYDKENLIEKYAEQTRTLDKEEKAQSTILKTLQGQKQERDSLFATIKRQINLLLALGGSSNVDRVEELYRTTTEIDTTYLPALHAYGDFLYGQLQYEKSQKIYAMLERNAQSYDQDQYLHGTVMEAAAKRLMNEREEAETLLVQALTIIDTVPHNHRIKGLALYHLGQIKISQNDMTKSIEYYLQSIKEYEQTYETDTLNQKYMYDLARVETACGAAYDDIDQGDEAIKHHQRSIEIMTKAYKQKARGNTAMLAYAHQYLARSYDGRIDHTMFDKALEHYEIADTLYQKVDEINPQAYKYYLALLHSDKGTGYFEHGMCKEAMKELELSNEIFKEMITKGYGNQKTCEEIIRYNEGFIEKIHQTSQQDSLPVR